jgi:hypothetical protein
MFVSAVFGVSYFASQANSLASIQARPVAALQMAASVYF